MPYTDSAPFSLTFIEALPRGDFLRAAFSARRRSSSAWISSDTERLEVKWEGTNHTPTPHLGQREAESAILCVVAQTSEDIGRYDAIEVIRAGIIMQTDTNSTQTQAIGGDADGDNLIDRICQLTEPQALEFYSQLSPRLQWLVRQRTTGRRKAALIAHHVITAGGCR